MNERLQELIRRLTMRFGGQWPHPHITLLSGIEFMSGGADRKLAELGQRLRPIPIRLGTLEGRNDQWRCFFAHVEPCPELLDAHQAACDVFGVRPSEPFEPHLSLLYGHIDAPTKLRLAKEFGGRLSLTFTATSVHLVNASRAVPVARWHTLHEAPLRRSSRDRAHAVRSASAHRA